MCRRNHKAPKNNNISIIVHGGAGKIENIDKRKAPLIKACELGYEVLKSGGSAIDAVTKAVVYLEDNPWFNAGTGSVLNIDGEVELDASIMSSDLSAGAVGAIKDVKNPILVAKKLMEETDHIMLVGDGATKFARLTGFESYNPITPRREKLYHKKISELKKGKLPEYVGERTKKFIKSFDTVGACALDKNNRLASATSTGGTILHLVGRVGDTAIIGAGTYANEFGAVSCTGHGECIMRLCIAKAVCDLMGSNVAQKAVNLGVKIASKNNCRCGIIGIDREGNVGAGYTTLQMIYAFIDKKGELKEFL
jgi:beta-aspartyl-peptidase (threonine type)